MQEEIITTRWGTAVIDRSQVPDDPAENARRKKELYQHLCPGDHEPAARPPGDLRCIYPPQVWGGEAVMAKNKKHEMHTYTADVQLVEQNGIYFIYKNGERYIGPILPADAGIMLASVHEVLAKEWVAGREAELDALQNPA